MPLIPTQQRRSLARPICILAWVHFQAAAKNVAEEPDRWPPRPCTKLAVLGPLAAPLACTELLTRSALVNIVLTSSDLRFAARNQAAMPIPSTGPIRCHRRPWPTLCIETATVVSPHRPVLGCTAPSFPDRLSCFAPAGSTSHGARVGRRKIRYEKLRYPLAENVSLIGPSGLVDAIQVISQQRLLKAVVNTGMPTCVFFLPQYEEASMTCCKMSDETAQ